MNKSKDFLKAVEKTAEKYLAEKTFFDSLKERQKEFEELKKILLSLLSDNDNHIVTKNFNLNRIIQNYTVYNVPEKLKKQYAVTAERQSLHIVPAK